MVEVKTPDEAVEKFMQLVPDEVPEAFKLMIRMAFQSGMITLNKIITIGGDADDATEIDRVLTCQMQLHKMMNEVIN